MPAPRKYSDELRERAVRMVEESVKESSGLSHTRGSSDQPSSGTSQVGGPGLSGSATRPFLASTHTTGSIVEPKRHYRATATTRRKSSDGHGRRSRRAEFLALRHALVES